MMSRLREVHVSFEHLEHRGRHEGDSLEGQDSHDPLLWAQPLQDHVGVVDDVAREDETTTGSKGHVDAPPEGKEDLNKAEADEEHESTVEPRAHAGEVSLGLEGEERQAGKGEKSDDEGLEQDALRDVRCDQAEGEGLDDGKESEETEIQWVRVSLPEEDTHRDKATDQCDNDRPLVVLNPGRDGASAEEIRGNRSSENLQEEHGINLKTARRASAEGASAHEMFSSPS